MGYRLKPFTMSVRNNSTQQFVDVGLLGSASSYSVTFSNTSSGKIKAVPIKFGS